MAHGLALAVVALDMQAVEVFEAREPPKPFAALLKLVCGIEFVERIAVRLIEPDTVVADFEAVDSWNLVEQPMLLRAQHGHLDTTRLRLAFGHRLDSVDDQLNDRRVNGSARPDVVDHTPDIDVAHRYGRFLVSHASAPQWARLSSIGRAPVRRIAGKPVKVGRGRTVRSDSPLQPGPYRFHWATAWPLGRYGSCSAQEAQRAGSLIRRSAHLAVFLREALWLPLHKIAHSQPAVRPVC
jgi:hypothetical protein